MEGSAEELDRLAVRARCAAEVVEAHRAALGRYALVWWTGAAADRYWAHVEERRARLGACADGLADLAALAAATAAVVRSEARTMRALGVPG
jgi:hypothetical protein